MAETDLETPWGTFVLHRGETPLSSPLRAWSAADRLVLGEVEAAGPGDGSRRLVVVNDAWGALAVPLAEFEPMVWNDSALSLAAIDANLARNGLPLLEDRFCPATAPVATPVELALVMVPKSHDLLAWQLDGIASALAPEGRVVVAGMSKHLTKGVVRAIEARFDEVTVRRAVGKARLIDAAGPKPRSTQPGADPLAERSATRQAFVTDAGVEVHEAPGVFSAGHLDVGTALLLDTLRGELAPAVDAATTIVDLGCGNGVIGATIAAQNPTAALTFADVSYLAIEATRATAEANWLSDRATFVVADGLPGHGNEADVAGTFDLIVSNPPFHQDHAADGHLTDRLLEHAAQRLGPDGQLVIVVQRHLELHRRISRFFDDVTVHSEHPTHVVLAARV